MKRLAYAFLKALALLGSTRVLSILLLIFYTEVALSEPTHIVHPTKTCRVFQPGRCGFKRTGWNERLPFCHIGDGTSHLCKFDMKKVVECPLPLEGSYIAEAFSAPEDSWACRSSYTLEDKGWERPACGAACCLGDLKGTFFNPNQDLSHHKNLRFQPVNASCQYHEYFWRDAKDCLAGGRLVIAGDSIMRQLFNAAIAMFRGQDIAIDYNKHAHGRYQACDGSDKLTFSSFQPSRFEIPIHEVNDLFSSQEELPSACSEASQIEVDYLWAPRFADLTSNLLEFHQHFGGGSRELSYLVFAGFWEDREHVSTQFLAALDTIRAAAKFLIVVGVPRASFYRPSPAISCTQVQLYAWRKDNAAIRNRNVRQWVSHREPSAGGNVLYLDFDQLASAENAPPGVGSLNWHFQCFWDHAHRIEAIKHAGNLEGSWFWPEAPDHLYPSIWTDDTATCSDFMNKAVLQIALNLICNKRQAVNTSAY